MKTPCNLHSAIQVEIDNMKEDIKKLWDEIYPCIRNKIPKTTFWMIIGALFTLIGASFSWNYISAEEKIKQVEQRQEQRLKENEIRQNKEIERLYRIQEKIIAKMDENLKLIMQEIRTINQSKKE